MGERRCRGERHERLYLVKIGERRRGLPDQMSEWIFRLKGRGIRNTR